MSNLKLAFVIAIITLLLAACGTGQEQLLATPQTIEVPVTVEVTRIVEVMAEVTVEVPVEIPVEVTRLITEIVIETKEVPVEVTRLVEVEVTPTPEPTAETTTTNSTNNFSNAQLLNAMNSLRNNLLELGGMLDGRNVYCDTWLEKHDHIANMPTFNTTYANDTSKWAYEQYRAAISTFINSSKDLTENTRISCVPGSTIPFQQWGPARQGINQATDILQPAIRALGGQ